MILEHCSVVVEDGQPGPGVDVEVVGRPAVVKVMNDRSQQTRKDLQIRQPILKSKSK